MSAKAYYSFWLRFHTASFADRISGMFSRAGSDDLPFLERLEITCFPFEFWGRGTLSQILVQERFWIWFDSRAYVIASVCREEAEIERIGVVAAHQGNGVGTAILGFALEQLRAQNIERIYLEVNEHNIRARRLYARFGFVLDGVRPNYYGDGGDAILMSLTVK